MACALKISFKGATYKENSRGPKTNPCGTPLNPRVNKVSEGKPLNPRVNKVFIHSFMIKLRQVPPLANVSELTSNVRTFLFCQNVGRLCYICHAHSFLCVICSVKNTRLHWLGTRNIILEVSKSAGSTSLIPKRHWLQPVMHLSYVWKLANFKVSNSLQLCSKWMGAFGMSSSTSSATIEKRESVARKRLLLSSDIPAG